MLSLFSSNTHSLHKQDNQGVGACEQAVWLDLLNPTREEEQIVERALSIEVPTREDMQEIELSNRLYSQNGAVYMTATVIAHMDTETPQVSAVTFILSKQKLVTVRYAELKSVQNFILRAQKTIEQTAAPFILLGLLESFINRIADVLEQVAAECDILSRDIFTSDPPRIAARDFQDILRRIGRKGDLSSKTRESLASLARLVHYMQDAVDVSYLPQGRDLTNRLKALDKDILSIQDHLNFIATKINFLQDATLGFINIEQNKIIKIFSLFTVALLPPTLIGAVYGMNFVHIPELNWLWGYPFALALMAFSALLPLIYFRRKGWL